MYKYNVQCTYIYCTYMKCQLYPHHAIHIINMNIYLLTVLQEPGSLSGRQQQVSTISPVVVSLEKNIFFQILYFINKISKIYVSRCFTYRNVSKSKLLLVLRCNTILMHTLQTWLQWAAETRIVFLGGPEYEKTR